MLENKNTPIYQATDEDKAFNEKIKAELEKGDIPTGPQETVRINVPEVGVDVGKKTMKLSGIELDSPVLTGANDGEALRQAMDKATSESSGQDWERTGGTNTDTSGAESLVAAAGRSDIASPNMMTVSSESGISAEQLAALNVDNQPKIDPTGWERPKG